MYVFQEDLFIKLSQVKLFFRFQFSLFLFTYYYFQKTTKLFLVDQEIVIHIGYYYAKVLNKKYDSVKGS